jgi:hypothetical protein
MIIELLFYFFSDVLCYLAFQEWVSSSLLLCFIVVRSSRRPTEKMVVSLFYTLFLLENFIVLGSVNGGVIVMMVTAFMVYVLRSYLLKSSFLISVCCLFFIVMVQEFVGIMILFGVKEAISVSFQSIFGKLVVSVLVFLGLQGSRSLFVRLVLKDKERKVWTPNRRNAS